MKRIAALTAAATSLAFAAGPPAKDREAILAMAGTHAVTFEFQETAAIAPGYKLKTKPYKETATEVVIVVENSQQRIALQNLLVVPGKEGKPHVIKHWAQIWTWQDTELLDYSGSEEDHRPHSGTGCRHLEPARHQHRRHTALRRLWQVDP